MKRTPMRQLAVELRVLDRLAAARGRRFVRAAMLNARNTTKHQQRAGRLLLEAWEIHQRMRSDQVRLRELGEALVAA